MKNTILIVEDEQKLAELLKEGAALNQQELINRLLADCG